MDLLSYLRDLLAQKQDTWDGTAHLGRGPVMREDTTLDPYYGLPKAKMKSHKDLLWQLELEKRQRPYPPEQRGSMAHLPTKKYLWNSDIPLDNYSANDMEYEADQRLHPKFPYPPNYLDFLGRQPQ